MWPISGCLSPVFSVTQSIPLLACDLYYNLYTWTQCWRSYKEWCHASAVSDSFVVCWFDRCRSVVRSTILSHAKSTCQLVAVCVATPFISCILTTVPKSIINLSRHLYLLQMCGWVASQLLSVFSGERDGPGGGIPRGHCASVLQRSGAHSSRGVEETNPRPDGYRADVHRSVIPGGR